MRLTALDGLRAIAVVLVIAHHAFFAVDPPLFTWWALGPAGVRLFFVLSGFLITGILLDARSKSAQAETSRRSVLRAFYLRRVLRIVPLAALAMTVAWTLDLGATRAHWLYYVTYTSNVLHAQGIYDAGLAHFWSLAVEEQFYLVWPAVMLWTPSRYLPHVFGVAIIGPALLRPWLPEAAAYALTVSRFDALACGGWLAWRGLHRTPVGTLALIGVALVLTTIPTCIESGMVLLSTAVIAFVASRRHRAVDRVLCSTPLVYLGTISYGVYVWHFLLQYARPAVERTFDVWLRFPDANPVGAFAWLLVVSVTISAVSWHLFERPINELKHRVPYVPRSVPNTEQHQVARRASTAAPAAS